MTSVCRIDESMDFDGQNVIQLIVYNGRNIEIQCLAVHIPRTNYVISMLYITYVHEYFSKRKSVCVCVCT